MTDILNTQIPNAMKKAIAQMPSFREQQALQGAGQAIVEKARQEQRQAPEREFLPQSIPFFAATEAFNYFRHQYPDYAYKEAALNPTNPRDRTSDWEMDVVDMFRNDAAKKDFAGQRETPVGPVLFVSRPIRLDDGRLPQVSRRCRKRASRTHQAIRRGQWFRLGARRRGRSADREHSGAGGGRPCGRGRKDDHVVAERHICGSVGPGQRPRLLVLQTGRLCQTRQDATPFVLSARPASTGSESSRLTGLGRRPSLSRCTPRSARVKTQSAWPVST